ncbi:BlaI/MecI/CopY family transcriptional regulator [Streptomyces sp. AC512_CC834]|uniref:BlaI/MecI/CopY family transcriptional regulator n=1 Tax=Streptomyces sp. AC512_CC834 TaxID=2823691 RepID=UPI001C27164F|nr:BlaI/MecI/CopY family transcriptional regulator [Streptomyces sp. AC512_CC834]
MSESTMQSATELASQYSVQVTDDLERNVKEQERVSAEITALQQQLAALQHDHGLLVNMQQALGITSPPTQSVTAPERAPVTGTAAVPAPRDSAAAETATGRRTRNKRAAAAPKRAAAPKPGAKPASKPAARKATKTDAKPAAKSVAKTDAKPEAKKATKTDAKAAGKPAAKKAPAPAAARPTLVELVRNHLTEQSEPRSAAEVTTALGEAHSGRTVKTTVVRTTLEGLVAKNQAQRTKQGTSVYYTATATDATAPKPKPDTAAEAAPAARSGS